MFLMAGGVGKAALTEQMCGPTGCRFTDCTFQSVSAWMGGDEMVRGGEASGGEGQPGTRLLPG